MAFPRVTLSLSGSSQAKLANRVNVAPRSQVEGATAIAIPPPENAARSSGLDLVPAFLIFDNEEKSSSLFNT